VRGARVQPAREFRLQWGAAGARRQSDLDTPLDSPIQMPPFPVTPALPAHFPADISSRPTTADSAGQSRPRTAELPPSRPRTAELAGGDAEARRLRTRIAELEAQNERMRLVVSEMRAEMERLDGAGGGAADARARTADERARRTAAERDTLIGISNGLRAEVKRLRVALAAAEGRASPSGAVLRRSWEGRVSLRAERAASADEAEASGRGAGAGRVMEALARLQEVGDAEQAGGVEQRRGTALADGAGGAGDRVQLRRKTQEVQTQEARAPPRGTRGGPGRRAVPAARRAALSVAAAASRRVGQGEPRGVGAGHGGARARAVWRRHRSHDRLAVLNACAPCAPAAASRRAADGAQPGTLSFLGRGGRRHGAARRRCVRARCWHAANADALDRCSAHSTPRIPQ